MLGDMLSVSDALPPSSSFIFSILLTSSLKPRKVKPHAVAGKQHNECAMLLFIIAGILFKP